MKVDPMAPAYPGSVSLSADGESVWNSSDEGISGMNIRTEIASRILAGLFSNPDVVREYLNVAMNGGDKMPITMARTAVINADALIHALNEDDGENATTD